MWRSRTSRAARLRQNAPTAPAAPAPIVSRRRLEASFAASLIARPAAEAATRRRAGPIIDVPPAEGALDLAGFASGAGLRPTTKEPRKETDADHRRQGGEGLGLDGLDQGI